VWGDVDTIRSSFGRDGVVSSVTVALDSPAKQAGFEAAVEHDKQLGLEAFPERVYYEKQSEGTATFINIVGWVVSVFFMIAAIIGAFITMNTAVAHRQREVGTLRALGFSRFAVLTSFVIEATVLALFGATLGIMAAFLMTFGEFSMMNFATWSEIVFSFTMTSDVIVNAVVVGVVMGLLGGIIPAARAARLKPIDALRA
jgi:putative ABC transport system permease protein